MSSDERLGGLAVIIVILLAMLIFAILGAVYVARRWLLTTVAIFVALVIINQVYVLWLEPLAEH